MSYVLCIQDDLRSRFTRGNRYQLLNTIQRADGAQMLVVCNNDRAFWENASLFKKFAYPTPELLETLSVALDYVDRRATFKPDGIGLELAVKHIRRCCPNVKPNMHCGADIKLITPLEEVEWLLGSLLDMVEKDMLLGLQAWVNTVELKLKEHKGILSFHEVLPFEEK